jgi:hypothetical protein
MCLVMEGEIGWSCSIHTNIKNEQKSFVGVDDEIDLILSHI